jgi:hypothetical protein
MIDTCRYINIDKAQFIDVGTNSFVTLNKSAMVMKYFVFPENHRSIGCDKYPA